VEKKKKRGDPWKRGEGVECLILGYNVRRRERGKGGGIPEVRIKGGFTFPDEPKWEQ